MKIKKDTAFKKWFDIPDSDGTRIELCEKSQGESLIALEAIYTKASIGGDISDDVEKAYVDAISDWQGLEDEGGKTFKPTLANKKLFLRQPGMFLFLKTSLADLRQEIEEEREAAGKN